MLTRSTTQRLFLLRPDDETNNNYVYCLAEAAQRYQIEVILTQVMSNHHHPVFYDPHGKVNEFIEHFHKMLAKCQNVLRGRWENLWSSEPPCLVELVDRAAVIDKLVYVATNPVKDGLVEKVHHWPGVDAWRALRKDEPLRAKRPRYFFSKDGVMPAEVELRLVVPSVLGDRDELVREVSQRIASVEEELAQQRLETGRRVVGRRHILRQSPRDSPTSERQHRGLRPRVATRSKWNRIAALQRNKEFEIAYREARAAWLSGLPAKFPPGTYWLRRFANVPIATT
ncbi:MAG: hypothetical protein JWP01_559 [Myxococcales bacterium]|nr:hypothetical protein [Myxococcales bacterium]